MFRTANLRGQKRFSDLNALRQNKPGLLSLTSYQIKLIENAKLLSLGEKIELFLIALGNKLTTELYLKLNYVWNKDLNKEIPVKSELATLTNLLNQLPFSYFQDELPKKNRQTDRMQNFTWFQVSVNESMTVFMRSYPDDLTEFEEGVIYGYRTRSPYS